MLKQEMFYEVQLWGCVSTLLGLPAELIPQMFVTCLTTGIIIPVISRIVNRFRKIFSRKLKKAKPPRTERYHILYGEVVSLSVCFLWACAARSAAVRIPALAEFLLPNGCVHPLSYLLRPMAIIIA